MAGKGEGGETRKDGQFALPLALRRDYAASRFVASASNAEARLWLAQGAWPERRLWLWGEAGCGKTHLLSIWAERRGALHVEAERLSPELFLSELPPGGVAVDGLDSPFREDVLLHLLNHAREQRRPLLLAGRAPPARRDVHLPDLASRLRATTAIGIRAPDDALRANLLLRLLAERQIVVSQSVMDWLLRHLPRTADAVLDAVERLDGAALARGQAVTRALAREVLGDRLHPDGREEI